MILGCCGLAIETFNVLLGLSVLSQLTGHHGQALEAFSDHGCALLRFLEWLNAVLPSTVIQAVSDVQPGN